MTNPVSASTFSRAFDSQRLRADITDGNPKIVHRAKSFGNPGGIKDLVLSILTFGVYALAKLSIMEEKERVAEKAVKELCEAVKSRCEARGPGTGPVGVSCERDELSVEQVLSGTNFCGSFGPDCKLDVRVLFCGDECARIDDMTLEQFRDALEAEVAYLERKNGAESADIMGR
ncbi:hypothetical protein IAG25_39840 [Caballeronia sp. EK]|uniref:hypothetical protein n=1 Tax=Caballeronia sp. EK TaxID=2767469 RepID=UPI0016554842|nr:hypothetical protein [Caballeronia sp. EK]MBC8642929.1 hypothetical protein [Caballeronia sp. EK]